MNIVVLSKAPFPDGTAPSTYVLNVCRTMVMSGHNVTVYGCRRGIKTDHPSEGTLDGIRYVNFDAVKQGRLLTYLYDNYHGQYIVQRLSRMKEIDIVFLFGDTVSVAKCVKKYCERKHIKYGAFNCEWFTEDCFAPSVSKKYVKDTVGLIPYNAKHADKAILISSLLTDHFAKQGIQSVMIPNIVDLTDAKWDARKAAVDITTLKLAYAGVPGVGKDELATVVEAIGMLPDEKREKTELHVYGPDEAALLFYLKSQGMNDIPSYVFCHGKQKQDEIPARLNECHYTVLIRKSTLRTNAGFSTKMVESFAAGIPMIANVTGDIGTYLRDGENGVVVSDDTAVACCEALGRAWELLDKNSEMRGAALKTARECFDYRLYKDVMHEFLMK